jgi:hypothetical protein
MNREELITRLEALRLPDVILEDHRRELRASLLAEYSRASSRKGPFGWLRSRPLLWRTGIVTSAAWLLVLIALVATNVIPMLAPYPGTEQAVNAVLAHPLVKAALGGDSVASVTVTPLDAREAEVVIAGGAGTTIIARAESRGGRVRILEITYIILFGSIFEPEVVISGQEAERIEAIATTNRDFRKLVDRNVRIERIVSLEALVSTRELDTGAVTETRGRWAMVELTRDTQRWFFLVDPSGSRVINESTDPIPD